MHLAQRLHSIEDKGYMLTVGDPPSNAPTADALHPCTFCTLRRSQDAQRAVKVMIFILHGIRET
jgi:hypothetical protein